MHIVYNGWFWDRPDVGSGQYIRRLLQHLRRTTPELDMTLVLPPHNRAPDDLPPDVNLIVAPPARFSGALGKVWFEQRTFPRLARQSGAHLAHVPYWGPPLSSPLPLVTSVLDVYPLIDPAYTPGLSGRLYSALVSAGARGSNHIITLSESARLDIEQYLQIPEHRVSAIYLAPDAVYHPRIGAEGDAALREKYNLPERFVLYLGGFDRRKQVNELLLAYTYVAEAEGDNIPLVLAGAEPQWREPLFPDLREYAQRLGLEDYLRWIGYVDEADKAGLYRLADVFVSPSGYEGFGLPVIEALACGTPVVAFDTDVYDETLGDAAFLVEDARSMAGAIIALLLQPPLRETMVNQGLARATQYNWRKTAAQTLRVYEHVLAGGRVYAP